MMSGEPSTAGPATYAGTWEVGESDPDELPGILLVPNGDADEPARFHAYVHDDDRIYSAELRPAGQGWSGEESRRSPHRFQLKLKAFMSDGALVAFGTLRCDERDPEGDGLYIGASFDLQRGVREEACP